MKIFGSAAPADYRIQAKLNAQPAPVQKDQRPAIRQKPILVSSPIASPISTAPAAPPVVSQPIVSQPIAVDPIVSGPIAVDPIVSQPIDADPVIPTRPIVISGPVFSPLSIDLTA